MKETETQIDLTSHCCIKNIINKSSDKGIINSLLEKYKPSDQVKKLADRNHKTIDKVAA